MGRYFHDLAFDHENFYLVKISRYMVTHAVLKAICTRVGFGSGTKTRQKPNANYRSVPQIRPPSHISPPAFLAQSRAEVFLSRA